MRLYGFLIPQILRHIQVAQAHGLVGAELHRFLALAGNLAALLQVADLLLHRLGQLNLALVEQACHSALELLGRPGDIAGLEILQRARLELEGADLLDDVHHRRVDLRRQRRVAA